jgi:hypothetical protein
LLARAVSRDELEVGEENRWREFDVHSNGPEIFALHMTSRFIASLPATPAPHPMFGMNGIEAATGAIWGLIPWLIAGALLVLAIKVLERVLTKRLKKSRRGGRRSR